MATYVKAWEWESKEGPENESLENITLAVSQGREKPLKNSEDLRRECCFKYWKRREAFFWCVNCNSLFSGILCISCSQLRIMFLRIMNVERDSEH